ncbi:MAG: Pre-mRNA-splicing factor cwc26 [Icmadophila ericetorum]|nr:Pre-mRNA-splicing factor cwc26 [Icmadophila ericetorum]
MSLADYLAKNYLTADWKPEKKSKKRKRKDASSGLIIADDDQLGWDPNGTAKEDDDGPLTVNNHSAEFRKSKSNNWKTLTGGPANLLSSTTSDQAAADAIIASAAAENRVHALEDEDAPTIDHTGVTKMESGAHAGLQSAAQVTAQLKRQQDLERQRFLQDDPEHSGKGKETIYRDASGRAVNIASKRAEARAAAEEAERKARLEAEAAKGDVQRAQTIAKREELKEAAFLPLARYADDRELNEELKERERWNDPAAAFVTKKKVGKSVTGKPLYQGAWMPNRYGIRPGYRWDGVDRGNGFEGEYFKARNRKKNLKELDYAWQMDE